MKTRVITAICIIAAVAIPVALGGVWLNLLAVFILVSGLWEWCRNLEGFGTWGKAVLPVLIVLTFLSRWMMPVTGYAWLAICGLILWSVPVFCESFTVQDSWSVISGFLFMTLVWPFPCLQRNPGISGLCVLPPMDRIPAPILWGRNWGNTK